MKLKFQELKSAINWIEANSVDEWVQVREEGWHLILTCEEHKTGRIVTIEISDVEKSNSQPMITRTEVLK